MSRSSDRRAKPRSLTTSKIVSQTTKALPPRDHVKTVAGQDSSDGGAKGATSAANKARDVLHVPPIDTGDNCGSGLPSAQHQSPRELCFESNAICGSMQSAEWSRTCRFADASNSPTPPAELHISFVRQGLQLPLFGPLGPVRGVTLSELQENARKTLTVIPSCRETVAAPFSFSLDRVDKVIRPRIGRTSIGFVLMIGLIFIGQTIVRAETDNAEKTNFEQTAEDKASATIKEIGTKYIAAFNKKDAKAVADFWSPEAVYTDEVTGEQFVGRKAIADLFTRLFESDNDSKLDIDVQSIDFLSPNIAIERGAALYSSDPHATIPYSAIYIRRDGQWLLDRVTDKEPVVAEKESSSLEPLAWMIGTWTDQSDGVTVDTVCDWTSNKNFISRKFHVAIDGEDDVMGLQLIGWDANAKRIKSWTFDSDGGHSQANWSQGKDEGSWYAVKSGVTGDGRRVSAVNVITLVDDNTFKLKAMQRSVDGKMLPSTPEVTVVKQ